MQLDGPGRIDIVLDIFMVRLTLVIVEPAGMFPAMLKASTPRRISP